jgi:Protein of unknown function, DUF481
LKKLLFILSCILNHTTVAQYSDSVFYYTGLTSTGTFNKTTTSSSYLVNNMAKFGARKKALAFNSTNTWLYGRQGNALTNNDFSSVCDWDLYKTFPHFYYWGLLTYNSTYSLKINNQLQAGIGGAYNVVDKKMLTVNISDGIIYDYSDLILGEGQREIYGTPRNSFRLRIKYTIKDRLVFSGTGYLQNSLMDQNDYIIKSDVNLSIKLNKWLSFTTAYGYNQVTRTKSESWLLTYGITVERYF